MTVKTNAVAIADPFQCAREVFEVLVEDLGSEKMSGTSHSELEELLSERGQELLRQLFQGYLEAQGPGAAAEEVKGSDGVLRTHERDGERTLTTIFGRVLVQRKGYRAREATTLYPRDGELNLPKEQYSYGTRKRVAEEAAKGSYEEVVATVKKTTGARVAKRQAEEMVQRAASDFDEFYAQRGELAQKELIKTGPILVLTTDGKGVVMRKEALREATRKAAEERPSKTRVRLQPGEKPNAKRMAQVAAVYTIARYVRSAEEVMGELAPVHVLPSAPRPKPEHKRVWASLEKEPEEVIEAIYREGQHRDPQREKEWVALVDGNKQQIRVLLDLAKQAGQKLVLILDFIHVLEYLWKAAHVLVPDDGKEREAWVRTHALELLKGHASQVAAGIRRSATLRGLEDKARKAVDDCANYLLNYAPYLRYDKYLAAGFPIATGVIEGACRHLVKDRMERSGARWGLLGAEAVLKLRSLRSSGDFEAYWKFHERTEFQRNHQSLYANGVPATQKGTASRHGQRSSLKLVP